MNPIGYWTTCDDAYCAECFNGEMYTASSDAWEGFEDWDEPIVIFGHDERDTPTHCEECGDIIAHNLTREGYAYVREAIVEDLQRDDGYCSPVVAMWRETYMQDTVDLFDGVPYDPHPAYAKYRELV